MTRNLKALGLALVAVFAMSVVGASAAQAASHHFDGTVGDALEAHALTTQIFKPVTGEPKQFECTEIKVAGKVEEATATSVTVEPLYSGCTAFTPPETTVSASVKPNGCHYRFTGVTTTGNPTGGEHATVDVICPEGKEIEIRVTGLNLKCSTVPAQEVKDAVRYEEDSSNPEGAVIVKATAHGFESKTVESLAGCGTETHTNGTYVGEATVTAPHGVKLTTNVT